MQLESIINLIGQEEWEVLKEEERDQILENAFSAKEMRGVHYAEQDWGAMVVRAQVHVHEVLYCIVLIYCIG